VHAENHSDWHWQPEMVTNTVSRVCGVWKKNSKTDRKACLPTTGKYERRWTTALPFSLIYDSGARDYQSYDGRQSGFGVRADYPFDRQRAPNFRKRFRSKRDFIAVTGYNLKGTGTALLVPVASLPEPFRTCWQSLVSGRWAVRLGDDAQGAGVEAEAD